MMSSAPGQVSLLSKARYDHRAPTGLPTACPTLDLSATWDEPAQTLFIYRPPDQVVSRIHQNGRGGRATPCAVAWKSDGRPSCAQRLLLAIFDGQAANGNLIQQGNTLLLAGAMAL